VHDPAAFPTPAELERAAAAAWRAREVEERDGWLLRFAPRVPHRRSNSALPLTPDADVSVPARFYAERGAPVVVAIAPAPDHAGLDESLAARGWKAEGHTNVLVAKAANGAPVRDDARHSGRPLPRGVERVDPFAWPHPAVGEDVLPFSRGEVLAFADGQRGAVLCVRTGELAGIFRLHVAPQERRQGVGSRLIAACATVAPLLYAQVEAGNDAAERLFGRAGFARSHAYHYRREPAVPPAVPGT
jgi:GNAT superfamily N-acetyltransferase